MNPKQILRKKPSVHVYGPSVRDQTYDDDPQFPKNMPAIWDSFFGSFVDGVIIGEWGGTYVSKDKIHQDALAIYLLSVSSLWFSHVFFVFKFPAKKKKKKTRNNGIILFGGV